jgi:hypothetical protein
MLGTPIDGIVLWAGLAVVSLVSLGVAVGLPSVAAPDARGLADAIDRVAASSSQASATVPVAADAIRLGSSRVSLRRAGRTSHASIALGPVTPVGDGGLGRVLRGESVRDVFDSPAAFGRALERYPVRPTEWRPAPDQLRVRRVSWGEYSGTLVG